MTSSLIRADARSIPLADDSVDLIVTSPPYFGLRSYTDGGVHYDAQIGAEATPAEFVSALIEVTREMVRVIKPSGSIWVNLGDKYSGSGGFAPNAPSNVARREGRGKPTSPNGAGRQALRQGGAGTNGATWGLPRKSLAGIPWRYALACIDDLGLILRAEVIWAKPNGMPEAVTDRVRRSHEQWFHFTKQPRYYTAVDEIRETYTAVQKVRGREPNSGFPGKEKHPATDNARSPLGKLPGSVWTVATQPLKVPAELGIDHFAAFPMEWPRRIIKGWCPGGGVVLDPFGGTGTTALVADALGRHGISLDMSADYCRLAQWRTADPGQIAKAGGARKPTKRARIDQSQLMLFEDL